ncbi:MAG TPA: ABC transporter substrate-binding protein [Opitutaceae bacterium]
MYKPRLLAAVVCAFSVIFSYGWCAGNSSATAPAKIKVGYIGITCEAPLFVAVEKGFFKEENLDVSLVKCDWSTYKDTIALGGVDITHHLIMMFLKPIEQGMDVKILAGVHKGCLRVQTLNSSSIRTVEALRGKRIGIPGMGSAPFIFATRAIGLHGLDPYRDITWQVFPAGELGLALEKGQVDAVATSEPIGTLLNSSGKFRNIADQANDEPFASEYCCGVVANGKFVSNNPQAAAAATRAILKAAKWVQANPQAAATLAVEKKYLASTSEINGLAISRLRYSPSISGGEAAVKTAAIAMQQAKMLRASTNLDELAQRAFARLDGVSDDWIKAVQVEKVAGGQLLTNVPVTSLNDASAIGVTAKSCCEVAKNE